MHLVAHVPQIGLILSAFVQFVPLHHKLECLVSYNRAESTFGISHNLIRELFLIQIAKFGQINKSERDQILCQELYFLLL